MSNKINQTNANMTPNTNAAVTTPANAPRVPTWLTRFTSETIDDVTTYKYTIGDGNTAVVAECTATELAERCPPRKYRHTNVPDVFGADGRTEQRADEIALRADIRKAVDTALNAASRKGASYTTLNDAAEKLLEAAYRVTIADVDLYNRHTELDAYAEKIASIVATHKTSAVTCDGMPYLDAYEVYTAAGAKVAEKLEAIEKLHRWAGANYIDNSAVAPVKSRPNDADRVIFEKIVVAGYKRFKDGVTLGNISEDAFRVQCSLYLVSCVQGGVIDKRKLERAKKREAEKMATEAAQVKKPAEKTKKAAAAATKAEPKKDKAEETVA